MLTAYVRAALTLADEDVGFDSLQGLKKLFSLLSFYIYTPNAFNILSCHFINSMRTQIYGVQLTHRENNALGSLQLLHTLH